MVISRVLLPAILAIFLSYSSATSAEEPIIKNAAPMQNCYYPELVEFQNVEQLETTLEWTWRNYLVRCIEKEEEAENCFYNPELFEDHCLPIDIEDEQGATEDESYDYDNSDYYFAPDQNPEGGMPRLRREAPPRKVKKEYPDPEPVERYYEPVGPYEGERRGP